MVPSVYLALNAVAEGGAQHTLMFCLAACLGAGMSGSKLMINTVVGDIFNMEDTSTALACSNIAQSLTAGSAFVIGPNASLRTKSRLSAMLGLLSFLAMLGVLPVLSRAKKAQDAKA